jgi:aldose 1-epimerase
MTYEARTSALTVINLTNHTYWNLGGSGTVLNHGLRLEASSYVEVDADLMPTGRLATVGGSPFDFRSERMVGERIGATGGGYDHCYALDAARDGGKLALAATLHDSRSGRVMEVSTTEPGVQLYTGNFLELASFPLHAALCLETQHFPDSVNHAQFPSAVLRPGQTFRQSTVHRFGVR